MKLPMEKWLEEQDVSEQAKSTFQEAMICYKAGAYRAAYLFSYLFFMLVVRDRILQANYSEEKRKQIQGTLNLLRDEDKWETTVMECIKNENNKRYETLEVKSKLRKYVDFYWRELRNNCAHAKDGYIDASHVEVFWHFLSSHMNEFVAIGSLEDALERINRHFDPTYTRRGADHTPLVQWLTRTISEDKIIPLIKGIFVNLDLSFIKETNKFLSDLVRANRFRPKFKEFLVQEENNDYLVDFLDAIPQEVILFTDEEDWFIRRIWKETAKKLALNEDVLMLNMLKFDMIPVEDREEFFNQMLSLQLGFFLGSLNVVDIKFLEEVGFIKYFYENVMIGRLIKDQKWGNKPGNVNSVLFYLKTYGWDKQIVTNIQNAFFGQYLWGSLKDELKKDSFRQQYQTVCEEAGVKANDRIL
ncbi:hypothetical protein [Laceyella putida]|uniref:HEPN AbiU2-like domain-containing protein n=1 Tax=Laceyella putida TaxID=110101 RepID=A0ABW2RQT7_9BACL